MDTHCYYKHFVDAKTYSEAHDFCQSADGLSADLVSINGPVENSIVAGLHGEASRAGTQVWIGAQPSGSLFFWTDGTRWSYARMGSGE